MAVAKGLVLAAIEKRFKGKSLSKTFKENLAAKWADKIETEDDIDGYVEDREDVVLEASTEADRRANAARDKALAEKKPAVEEEEEEVLPADTPEWAKKLIKENQETRKELEGFKQGATQKTIEERFKADPLLKGLPPAMLKGRIPAKEEDYEAYRDELIADYNGMVELNPSLPALGTDAPATPAKPSTPTEKAIDPAIKAFGEKEASKIAATAK